MNKLTQIDKIYLEKILDMSGGYVLNFTDRTFDDFFGQYGIDIHGPKYRTYGTSKAKKMRSFWDQESDVLVGQILSEMLDRYQASCDIDGKVVDERILERARHIVARLLGIAQEARPEKTAQSFLREKFAIPDIRNLPVEPTVVPIIESRLVEAQKTLEAGAYLSVVVLCGSILEGVLLGTAQNYPAQFNKSTASPKERDGRVKRFHKWRLSEFIDVATNLEILKPDVQKFSHGLRDFRNYIHPYQQMSSGFTPDEHTARVCIQVLNAALASVAGERP